MPKKKNRRGSDPLWDNRILCGDEGCIGTIGEDGHCRVCGLEYEGELPEGFLNADAQPQPDPTEQAHASDETTPSEPLPESETDSAPTTEAPQQADEPSSEPVQIDPDERILCRDESCIGTIGEDGLCRVCGLPLEDA